MKLLLVLTFFLANFAWAMTPYQEDLEHITNSKDTDSARLDRLFKSSWEYTMTTYPEWATDVGYPGQNARWTDNSLSAIELRKAEAKSTLQAIQSISRENLEGEEQISYDLFLKESERTVEGLQFPGEFLALNQMWGVQTEIADQMWSAPESSLQDYRDRLERLKAAPKVIADTQTLLSEGIKKGITQPRAAIVKVPDQILALMPENPEDSPIYGPFADMKKEFPEAERTKIQNEAKQILKAQVYPGLKTLHQFLVSSYLPNCRENIAFSTLPNGHAWYAFHVRNHTTTQMTPEEIHQLGLSEVARIKAEMEKVKEQAKFDGDLKEFNDFLKTEPQFFYSNAKDLISGYRDISRRIDPQLPKLFGRLPRLPYRIRGMPAYKTAAAPAAYYQGGSLETGRPGYFEANTGNMKDSPKWQMEALTLHEAVPGHHLQISIAQELTDLPDFRKQGGPTSFIEGWGLYAESLGPELGLYKDPYSKYGQLSFEILRAIRLVVDTGIHSKGWSRDQVIQYMKDNSPLPELMIINETDRYIADPGQALAYKIGELKFKELRANANTKLGEKFQIREFHDQLLGSGALPMDVIEQKMLTWMNEKATIQTKP